MGRKTPLTSLKQISEINLTPLMDLTFILLITFIITFPLIEQGIPVQLPQAQAASLASDQSQTITIRKDGALFLDDVPVTEAEFQAQMHALGAGAAETTIMVRADERVQYAAVVKVLKILHGEGVARMALVTQEE
ncbi:MAG: biopolymer transporter ExbD [Kiritimatiellia bacterium]|nr:biopolymer transporter ExbD [Kiritimatiellia bacterium]MDP6631519.1 biopolymer transporter ExbD [Kiritimatiellia bacterium]MDP6810579.1 biopolymer transporter ExbD [Kiritimatiellia bacterium]MDP7022834.1 biopolymer transporter ExbD [Kiritimatiellia bacterium]